mgnify:CR=1 FL=1
MGSMLLRGDGVEDIECSGVVATYGKAVGDMDVGMLLLLGRGGEPVCLVGIGKCGVVVEAVVERVDTVRETGISQ